MIGTYNRLNVHVWASDRAVIYACQRKIARHARPKPLARKSERSHREWRKGLYREMLGYHHEAQTLCREFRL